MPASDGVASSKGAASAKTQRAARPEAVRPALITTSKQRPSKARGQFPSKRVHELKPSNASMLSPCTLTALVAGVIAFYASARSLQLGPPVEVIALTSVAANLAAILGGVLVFDEPIGSGPLQIGARLIAFCLVIIGAALMPTHAEQLERDESSGG